MECCNLTKTNDFNKLKARIVKETKLDCQYYRDSYIQRRVSSRMRHINVDNYAQYMDYMTNHPDESKKLLDALTINVTNFFRDPDVFTEIERKILPDILTRAQEENRAVRIWSAGCSRGAEPYTLAMIVCDAMQKRGHEQEVIIYASDIDDESLKTAMKGEYSTEMIQGVSSGRLKKYFDRIDDSYQAKDGIKRLIQFKKRDLIKGVGFNSLDLILCRNVVIYFSVELKERLYKQFYKNLSEGGYLVLGKSEFLTGGPGELFTDVNNSARIYKKM